MGFDLNNIEIKKRRFPPGVKIDNYEINSFPILIIENKDYPKKWLEGFKEIVEDKSQVPSIFSDLWNTEEIIYNEEDDWLDTNNKLTTDPPF